MLSYPKLIAAALLSASILLICSQSANAQIPERASRIGPINESSRIVLKGNRHPLTTPANDRGEVAPELPMERMLLVLKREPAAESALQDLISSKQDKSSPAFHAWLSPEQFADRFGPSKSDLQTLTAWLQSHGFRVNRIARGGMGIEFSGTATQVCWAGWMSEPFEAQGKLKVRPPKAKAGPSAPLGMTNLLCGPRKGSGYAGFFCGGSGSRGGRAGEAETETGTGVTVRYDPENPGVSILEDRRILGRSLTQNPHWLP